jgi:hypothetical protein
MALVEFNNVTVQFDEYMEPEPDEECVQRNLDIIRRFIVPELPFIHTDNDGLLHICCKGNREHWNCVGCEKCALINPLSSEKIEDLDELMITLSNTAAEKYKVQPFDQLTIIAPRVEILLRLLRQWRYYPIHICVKYFPMIREMSDIDILCEFASNRDIPIYGTGKPIVDKEHKCIVVVLHDKYFRAPQNYLATYIFKYK